MSDTITYNIGAAKTKLSRLISLAEQGNEVVIARAGRPAVRLEPILPRVPRFGFLPDIGEISDDALFEPISDEELSLWEDGPVFPAGV